jgi:hypothetical protein
MGSVEEAEALSAAALELARKTEVPALEADALTELGCALQLRGRAGEAQRHFDEAITLYAAKGDVVSLARARRLAAGPA